MVRYKNSKKNTRKWQIDKQENTGPDAGYCIEIEYEKKKAQRMTPCEESERKRHRINSDWIKNENEENRQSKSKV